MVAHTTTTYLVTGANRGLGFGLVSALLERPHITVIASCRNLEHPTAEKLPGLSRAYNSRLILVEIDSLSETDPRAALDTLQTFHGIRSIDVLIANAGTGEYYGAAVTTPAEEYRKHFDVNALAPMILFQTFWPLLQKSPSPKFIAISSRLGSIDGLEFWAGLPGNALQTYMPAAPYGGSKAMLNYFMRRLHFEHANLIAFPLSPGWVQTDTGDKGATQRGMKKAPVTMEESIHGMLDKIDKATKEGASGHFVSWDDTQYAW